MQALRRVVESTPLNGSMIKPGVAASQFYLITTTVDFERTPAMLFTVSAPAALTALVFRLSSNSLAAYHGEDG